jgi:hypothetical protein
MLLSDESVGIDESVEFIVERVELPALHQMGIYHRGRGGANDLAGAEWGSVGYR